MIQLRDDEFHLAEGLVAPSPLTVESRAVISGSNPGWVFVDSIKEPRVGLVWAQGMRGFYLIGDDPPRGFPDKLREFARTTLAGRLHQMGLSWVEISATNTGCETAIRQAFADCDLQCDDQWIYRNLAGLTVQPCGEAIRLCEAIDANPNEESIDVLSKIVQFWRSVERFCETGTGYCVVENRMTVALCMSGFVDGTVHTVDIETSERHRRRGHAFSAASHFVSDCVGKGYTVHWDCMATNEASWRLAERLGLTRIAEYRCYYFRV